MGKYNERERIRSLKYYHAHKNDVGYREKRKEYRQKLVASGYYRGWMLRRKIATLTHYSNGDKPECVMCGFSDVKALSIDHINGGGTRERLNNPNLKGRSVYHYLNKMEFPDGYQTLCMNCQFIKRVDNNEAMGGKKRVRVEV